MRCEIRSNDIARQNSASLFAQVAIPMENGLPRKEADRSNGLRVQLHRSFPVAFVRLRMDDFTPLALVHPSNCVP